MSTSHVASQLCGEETVREWTVCGQVKRCRVKLVVCWSPVRKAASTSAVWSDFKKKTTEISVWCMKHICLLNNYSNAVAWFHSSWSWLDAVTFTLLFQMKAALVAEAAEVSEDKGRRQIKSILHKTAERCVVNVEEKKSWHFHVRPQAHQIEEGNSNVELEHIF